ncbi:hypothetical protein Ancab_014610 [Ancistrocladus abbreviatus]
MASRRNLFTEPDFLYQTSTNTNNHPSQIPNTTTTNHFEFDESDIWNVGSYDQAASEIPTSPSPTELKSSNTKTTSRAMRKPSKKIVDRPITSSSVPLKIPDWSKILGGDHSGSRRREHNNDGDAGGDDDEDDRIPPHEYVARQVARDEGCAVLGA